MEVAESDQYAGTDGHSTTDTIEDNVQLTIDTVKDTAQTIPNTVRNEVQLSTGTGEVNELLTADTVEVAVPLTTDPATDNDNALTEASVAAHNKRKFADSVQHDDNATVPTNDKVGDTVTQSLDVETIQLLPNTQADCSKPLLIASESLPRGLNWAEEVEHADNEYTCKFGFDDDFADGEFLLLDGNLYPVNSFNTESIDEACIQSNDLPPSEEPFADFDTLYEDIVRSVNSNEDLFEKLSLSTSTELEAIPEEETDVEQTINGHIVDELSNSFIGSYDGNQVDDLTNETENTLNESQDLCEQNTPHIMTENICQKAHGEDDNLPSHLELSAHKARFETERDSTVCSERDEIVPTEGAVHPDLTADSVQSAYRDPDADTSSLDESLYKETDAADGPEQIADLDDYESSDGEGETMSIFNRSKKSSKKLKQSKSPRSSQSLWNCSRGVSADSSPPRSNDGQGAQSNPGSSENLPVLVPSPYGSLRDIGQPVNFAGQTPRQPQFSDARSVSSFASSSQYSDYSESRSLSPPHNQRLAHYNRHKELTAQRRSKRRKDKQDNSGDSIISGSRQGAINSIASDITSISTSDITSINSVSTDYCYKSAEDLESDCDQTTNDLEAEHQKSTDDFKTDCRVSTDELETHRQKPIDDLNTDRDRLTDSSETTLEDRRLLVSHINSRPDSCDDSRDNSVFVGNSEGSTGAEPLVDGLVVEESITPAHAVNQESFSPLSLACIEQTEPPVVVSQEGILQVLACNQEDLTRSTLMNEEDVSSNPCTPNSDVFHLPAANQVGEAPARRVNQDNTDYSCKINEEVNPVVNAHEEITPTLTENKYEVPSPVAVERANPADVHERINPTSSSQQYHSPRTVTFQETISEQELPAATPEDIHSQPGVEEQIVPDYITPQSALAKDIDFDTSAGKVLEAYAADIVLSSIQQALTVKEEAVQDTVAPRHLTARPESPALSSKMSATSEVNQSADEVAGTQAPPTIKTTSSSAVNLAEMSDLKDSREYRRFSEQDEDDAEHLSPHTPAAVDFNVSYPVIDESEEKSAAAAKMPPMEGELITSDGSDSRAKKTFLDSLREAHWPILAGAGVVTVAVAIGISILIKTKSNVF